MADVLSKTSLISSWHRYNNNNHHHHQQQQSISVFPKNCNYKSFSCSLILKPEITSYKTDFHGKRIGLQQHRPLSTPRPCQASSVTNTSVQKTGFRIGKAHKWWEKGVQPNMKEISSAQDLVDSLTNAGDKLVVVDFFSPGCGGCKALHPKICQFAEMNPDVQFLQVNYEDHKSMCYSLNVHVLPFFRFYRGAHGRVCSFSCTNATIKKFRDALAKHKPDRCSLGPTKGLEEKELIALASNKDISFNYSRLHEPVPQESEVEAVPPSRQNSGPLPLPSTTLKSPQSSEGRNMVSAGR